MQNGIMNQDSSSPFVIAASPERIQRPQNEWEASVAEEEGIKLTRVSSVKKTMKKKVAG